MGATINNLIIMIIESIAMIIQCLITIMIILIKIIIIKIIIIIPGLAGEAKVVVAEIVQDPMLIIISMKRKKSIIRSLRVIIRIISKKFRTKMIAMKIILIRLRNKSHH